MKRPDVQIEYLWEDKRRYFGFPISFTWYRLSDDRLFMEDGLLNIREEEIMLYKVQDLHLNINLWQRFFGVGTITVLSTDQSSPKLELIDIDEPRQVKELIHRQVEKAKEKRRMRTLELMGNNSGQSEIDDLDLLF